MRRPSVTRVRKMLLEEKQRLQADRARLLDDQSDRPDADYTAGIEDDGGADLMELERTRALVMTIDSMLIQIEKALLRVEAGTYGICEVCGKPIAAARLTSIPSAAMCITCQSRYEA
ncbi:MAG: TraR/DksA C4-type zinc finger protein [Chthonomonadales bacterium]|nr:TraR/DksA C4-type zinc finger protein [Chthonomonadales bacterium]